MLLKIEWGHDRPLDPRPFRPSHFAASGDINASTSRRKTLRFQPIVEVQAEVAPAPPGSSPPTAPSHVPALSSQWRACSLSPKL